MPDIDQLTADFFTAAITRVAAAEATSRDVKNTAKNTVKKAEPNKLATHYPALQQALQQQYIEKKHGRKTDWDKAFAALPATLPSHTQIDANGIHSGLAQDLDISQAAFRDLFMQFTPWRKGPWHLFDVHIDTEWRSDWKWQRLQPHITPLAGRSVLDIGCGNGYHLFHMANEGAHLALGIDPTRLFLYQFHACKKYLPDLPAYLLPLRSEHLPAFKCFDTVFSLGVLYHRRSPIDHLTELASFLRPGGELVLETLVVPGNEQTLLTPTDRYAKMANVWFLPAVPMLETWLRRAGFVNVRTVDVNQTSTEEQRATDWMTFQSLKDFLDPADLNKSIEGYVAPTRATVIAEKPG